MSAPVATAVEIVAFAPASIRSQAWFEALAAGGRAEGLDVERTTTYRGTAPWLLLWGPGEPTRGETMRRHVAAGGHVIALDLAYWDRNRKARVSFDAPHPQACVMRTDRPASRFAAEQIPVVDRWKSTGKTVIAGIGEKARVQYGADVVDRWEREMANQCRARWPKRLVVYRKKKSTSPTPDWAAAAPSTPINQTLDGASLIITWHSNVAVDAICLGIPVVCRDGAAAAVCPSELSDDPRPLATDLRDRFLANLAWFQWAPDESRAFWRFVQETLA